MKKVERKQRANRAKTFSGISSDTLKEVVHLGVPDAEDVLYSSTGEMSSPETTPEPVEQKDSKKHKKLKKSRSVKTPPDNQQLKNFNPTMMLSPNIATPKIEKSGSFRRREKTTIDIKANKENVEIKENGQKRRGTPDKNTECNIVLLGDLGVGKTAFAVRFVTRRYLHEYDPVLERSYEKVIQIGGEPILVRLWDTVNKTWDCYSDQVDAFVVMFSVTSTISSVNAQNNIAAIRSSPLMKNVPILFAANKSELSCGRKVSEEEMERFATSNECLYKEISVACTNNIDPVVKLLVKQILLQEGGRLTPSALRDDSKSGLSRKPSNAKHKMKRFLSKKT